MNKQWMLVPLLALIAACGGQNTPAKPTPDPGGPVVITPPADADTGPTAPPEVQDALDAVGDWEAFAASKKLLSDKDDLPPQQISSKTLSDPSGQPLNFNYPTDAAEQDRYTCKVDTYELTRTPNKIVALSPDDDVLYVGSLIQGGAYGGTRLGSMRPLAFRDGERAPVALALNLTDGSDYTAIVRNPSLSTVRAATGGLIQAAQNNDAGFQFKATYELKASETLEDSFVKAGLSVKLGGKFSLDASTEVKREEGQNRLYVAYLETAYSLSMDAPAGPGDLFTDKFTQARLNSYIQRGEMGPGKPILYVSTITYGRMLIMEITGKARKEELLGSLNAKINFIKGEVGTDLTLTQKRIMNESSIRITAIGGKREAAWELINNAGTDGLKRYFSAENAPKASEYVPISYAVRDTVSKNYAGISETTRYDITTCLPDPRDATYADLWTLRINDVKQNYQGTAELGEAQFGQIYLNGKSIWRAKDPGAEQQAFNGRTTRLGNSLFDIETLLESCRRHTEGCEAAAYVLKDQPAVFAFDGNVEHRFAVEGRDKKNKFKRWGKDLYPTANFAGQSVSTAAGEGTRDLVVGGLKINYTLTRINLTRKEYERRPR